MMSKQVWRDVNGLIEGLVQDKPTMAAGMERLLGYCRDAAPELSSLWDELAALDYVGDLKTLSEWLVGLLGSEPPGPEINGLHFGLFNPSTDIETDDGRDVASSQTYLCGSARFDPRTPYNGWQCGPEYFPAGRYADSAVLPQINIKLALATNEDSFDQVYVLGEPLLGHGYLALVINEWMRGPLKNHLLGAAEFRGVSFGHDSGDLYMAGVLRADD